MAVSRLLLPIFVAVGVTLVLAKDSLGTEKDLENERQSRILCSIFDCDGIDGIGNDNLFPWQRCYPVGALCKRDTNCCAPNVCSLGRSTRRFGLFERPYRGICMAPVTTTQPSTVTTPTATTPAATTPAATTMSVTNPVG